MAIECARQWNQGLTQATRHGMRQLIAYQLLPTEQLNWDTPLVRLDGAPSAAMQLIAWWSRSVAPR